jgi:(E)-4-hydroxy-3-methylbut-2-enyl-diphosphate synthase
LLIHSIMTGCIEYDNSGTVPRRKSRTVTVGGRSGRRAVPIGGDSPVSVQSMIKRSPDDIDGIIADIHRLEAARCDLIRLTVPDEISAATLPAILKEASIPLIADIHFSPKAALASIDAGVDKIRLNPGNMPRPSDVADIARAAKEAGVPIRVGVNSGSLPKDLLEKYQGDRIRASVEGALRHIDMLRDSDFDDIVVAIKSSHTDEMIRSNRLLAEKCDLPIHLGVTEAGCAWEGNIRSAVGIGTLLSEGIGDTIRVSLTDDVVEEVRSGFEILSTLGLRQTGITFISCPTCGRLEADIRPIAEYLRDRLGHLEKPLRVALMGCAVNGPGEAAGSDICLLAGKEKGVIYRGMTIVRTIPMKTAAEEMEGEILRLYGEMYGE